MFGRRDMSALLHHIASTQLVVYKKTGVPRNPQAKAYSDKHLGEQAGLPPAKRGVASLHEDPLAQYQGDIHRS